MSQRPITRRRALIGGAVATGAALASGAGVVRYRSGNSTVSTGETGTPSPVPSPATTQAPVSPPRGGTGRIVSPGRFNFDTFDAQRTGEPSVLEVLGRTHARLVDWADSADPQLVPGLAMSWEQPDPETLIFHIDPRARWDERPPTNGRALTADDVREHFTRQLGLAAGALPLGQRPADFAKLHVASAGILTVMVRTEDDPWALNTFASRYALIQAPESLGALTSAGESSAEHLRGSGAFRFTGRGEGGRLVFEGVRGGRLDPNLDALEVFEPGSPDAVLARHVDEFIAHDRRDAATVRGESRLLETPRYEDSPVISSFSIGTPPWNNPALLRSLSGALNRTWLSDAVFGGRADPCSPVSPASGSFAPTQSQLARYPGFGPDAAAEAFAARATWDAAGGAGLGQVTIDFPSIFDPLYSASSVVVGRLNEVLGAQFRAAVETYTTISSKTADGRYGNGKAALWFGWGPPLLEPDPSRSLLETYSSTGPNAIALGLKPGPLDASLAAVANAPANARAAATRDAALAILDADGAGLITWLLQRSEFFHWPYLSGPAPSPFWRQHLDHTRTLDRNAAGFDGRPG